MTQHDRRQADAGTLVREVVFENANICRSKNTYLGSSPLLLLLFLLGDLLLQLLNSHAETDHKHSSHGGAIVEFFLVDLSFGWFDFLRVLVDCAVREGLLC
jgi:hypothetical protein